MLAISNVGLRSAISDLHLAGAGRISIAGALHFLWLHRWVDVLVEQARYVFLFQP